MNEHSFSSKILTKCREKGIAKAWKINDNFAGGVPDAWFLGNKSDLWIEFKWLNSLPKRESTIIKPDLSALQLGWLKMLQDHGRQAVVVIGYPKHAILLRTQSEWTTGISASYPTKNPWTHNELVDWIIAQT